MRTALGFLNRQHDQRYWYEDILNHNRLMKFPKGKNEDTQENRECREKLIQKIKEESSFNSYPIKVMDICEALSMLNGLEVHITDCCNDDVSCLMFDTEYEGTSGVFAKGENLIRVAEPSRPQRALRTEKHEYMHHFISLLKKDEIEELFNTVSPIIKNIKNKIILKKYKNRGIIFLQDEIFKRIDSNRMIYDNYKYRLEEYIVSLAEVYLYCEQHPDRKKIIMNLVKPLSKWFINKMLPKMEDYIRNHPKKGEIILPKWVEQRLNVCEGKEESTLRFSKNIKKALKFDESVSM